MVTWEYLTINIRYQWLPEEKCYRVWHYFPEKEPGAAHEEYEEEETFSHGQMATLLTCCLQISGQRGWELVSLPALRDDGGAHFLVISFKCPAGMHASSVEC
jgi:hypothetical protein